MMQGYGHFEERLERGTRRETVTLKSDSVFVSVEGVAEDIERKKFTSWSMARNCALPRREMGEAGCGLQRDRQSSISAFTAALVEESGRHISGIKFFLQIGKSVWIGLWLHKMFSTGNEYSTYMKTFNTMGCPLFCCAGT